MIFIVDKLTGKLLYTSLIEITPLETEFIIFEYPSSNMINPHWNFETNQWIDVITEDTTTTEL